MNLQKRVDRGIQLLDTHGPLDWRDRIDMDTLDLGDGDQCVLGQVFGDEAQSARPRTNGFWHGADRLFGNAGDSSDKQIERHGFAIWSGKATPRELTDEWILALASGPCGQGPSSEPEPREVLRLTRDDIDLLAKRQRQIDNPNHSMLATEIGFGNVRIVLGDD